MKKKQLHLNLFIYGRGHHEAAWRHPRASKRSLMDIEHYVECAKKAEAAHFDSIFLADVLNLPPDVDISARIWLEPLTTLGAIAHATAASVSSERHLPRIPSRSILRASSVRSTTSVMVVQAGTS